MKKSARYLKAAMAVDSGRDIYGWNVISHRDFVEFTCMDNALFWDAPWWSDVDKETTVLALILMSVVCASKGD